MDTFGLVGRVPAEVLADTAEDKQVKNALLGVTGDDYKIIVSTYIDP